MGCDIHSFAEVLTDGTWVQAHGVSPEAEWPDEVDEVFLDRDYGLFGFLADVRNYSHSPVIAEPRGLPDDVSAAIREEHDEFGESHGASWLTLAELFAYDYDQVFWDRRVTKNGNGAALADEGEGKHLTLREFLGRDYFRALDRLVLADPGAVRVVFWFDN